MYPNDVDFYSFKAMSMESETSSNNYVMFLYVDKEGGSSAIVTFPYDPVGDRVNLTDGILYHKCSLRDMSLGFEPMGI